jgi:ATP-dependent DNA helicase RecG
VKVGYFESDAHLRYHDEIRGGLIGQVNQTLELLTTKYLRAWISYQGLSRIETWPVPLPALREAVLNAVAHKNYASGIPIQISVYPDKLMIWNPGELPPEWTIEKLLGKHASIPFNPDVANVFFRCGLIEAWGRGIERILEACEELGTPRPEVGYEPSGVWMVFPFPPAHLLRGKGPEVASTRVTPVEAPVKTAPGPDAPVEATVERPVEAGAPVETTRRTPARILVALRANPGMTLIEVASQLQKSPRAVERATAKLIREGRLRRIGPRKGGLWEVLE